MSNIAAAKPEVFARRASGLVRVMSPYSAFIYNVLTVGLIFPWTYLWGPLAFPGGNLAIGILIAMLLEIPIAFAYVWLATSMPRSGGDYVFQSRMFGGAFGFTVVFSGFVIWVMQWVALSGWLMAVLGIAPLLLGFGVQFGNQGLINAGIFVQSQWGIIIVSVFFSALATWLLISGFKNYVRVQYFLFYAVLLAFVIMLVQFFLTTPEQFAASVDKFALALQGSDNFYNFLIQDVTAAGWNVNPTFSILATLGIAPIAWTSLQWATYSVQQGGEIKGAREFGNQTFILVGSLIFAGVLLAILAIAEERAVGSQFLSAAAAAYYGGISASGEGVGYISPFPNILAIVITSSPIIVFLIAVGYMANSFQIFCNCYIGMTRNMVAMSLDRILPEWVSRVSSRWHTPANAHIAYFIPSLAWILAYNLVPGWVTITLGVTFACGYVFALAPLAAAIMPWRAKAIYDASPGAKYKIGNTPLITVVGITAFVFGGAMVISFLLLEQLGLRGVFPYIVVGSIIAIAVIWYYLAKTIQSSKGINIGYAFKEVPPE